MHVLQTHTSPISTIEHMTAGKYRVGALSYIQMLILLSLLLGVVPTVP